MVAAELHAAGKLLRKLGQEGGGDVLVHEDALDGVAGAGALDFGVLGDAGGLVEVGAFVYEEVAHAGAGLNHGNLRVLHHVLYELCAASREHAVNQPDRAQNRVDVAVVGGWLAERDSSRHAVISRVGEPLPDCRKQRPVRGKRARRAAQQYRVPALVGKAECVHGHVGAALVDDGDHAERHTHLPYRKPAGRVPARRHLADGVALRDDHAHAFHNAVDALCVEHEPFKQRLAHAARAGGVEVGLVRGDDVVFMRGDCGRHALERAVFLRRRMERERALRRVQVLADVRNIHAEDCTKTPRPPQVRCTPRAGKTIAL